MRVSHSGQHRHRPACVHSLSILSAVSKFGLTLIIATKLYVGSLRMGFRTVDLMSRAIWMGVWSVCGRGVSKFHRSAVILNRYHKSSTCVLALVIVCEEQWTDIICSGNGHSVCV